MFGFGHKPAGVSIEQTGVRYLYFKNKNPNQVPKKKFLPLPSGLIAENQVADKAALIAELKPWVKKNGMRGKIVDLSIPPSQMIIRKMTIPSIDDKQIGQLVKLEVETGLHLPFDQPVYDYVITEQSEEESQLILLAAPRKVVQDYVDVLEESGLKVRSVEVSATALARAVTAGYGYHLGESMLIHLEQSLLDIYMFRSGKPVFMRTLDLVDMEHAQPKPLNGEGAAYLSELQAAAGSAEHLAPEQIVEITAEISRMLSFYQYSLHDGSARITEVLITGTPVLRAQLQEELMAALPELAITSLGIDQLGDVKVDYQLNDYRIAAGAALRGTERGPGTMDLLPREDRETVLFPYIAVSLAALWLLGVIGIGVLNSSLHGQLRDQTKQTANLQERNAALQLELAELDKTHAGSGALDRKMVIEALSSQRADAAAVLDELRTKLPPGAAIRETSYTFRGDLMLTVDFTAMEDSGTYLTALRGMSFASSATISKLSEGMAETASGALTNVMKYSAAYQIHLAATPLEQEDNGNGTNQ